jgi:PadR family transcriptional regulator, regulatory protein PadR
LHRDEIPPGTLYLLILRTLARSGEMHGYEIANSIQRISDDVLQVEEGSLYPALQRMLIKGWVTAKWGTTAGNRRARYYQLTAAGRKQLDVEMSQFERVIGAITRVRTLRPIARRDLPVCRCRCRKLPASRQAPKTPWPGRRKSRRTPRARPRRWCTRRYQSVASCR